MAADKQIIFIDKLKEELSFSSKTFRSGTLNFRTHNITITKKGIKKAVKLGIKSVFKAREEAIGKTGKVTPAREEIIDKDKTLEKKVMRLVQPHITAFYNQVVKNYERRIAAESKKEVPNIELVSKTGSKMVVSFIAYDKDDGSAANRYDSAYRQVLSAGKKLAPKIADAIKEVTGKEDRGDIKSGDIFNIEHEHLAGVLETGMFEKLDKILAEDSKRDINMVKKFLGVIGADITVIRDGTSEEVDVFVGSAPDNLSEGGKSGDRQTKLLEKLEEAVIKLQNDPSFALITGLGGSDSFEEKRLKQGRNAILEGFRKTKNATVDANDKINVSKTKKNKKTKRKHTAGHRKTKIKKGRARGRLPVGKGSASAPLQLIASLNKRLPQVVQKNMKSPALQYDTGRFADSVEVTDVITTRKGFPSVGFTYDRENYGQFEATSGSKQFASQERDPRKLIDKSIREIASKTAIGRFFTRRV